MLLLLGARKAGRARLAAAGLLTAVALCTKISSGIFLLLGMLYEVKANGLEPLFDELRDPKRKARLDALEPALRRRQK